MQDIKVSFFKTQFSNKPTLPETAMLSKIIAENIVTVSQDDIKAFAALVGDKGCTFCPATFKNGTRNKERLAHPKGPDRNRQIPGYFGTAQRYFA